jgi:yeast amino acid transporter
LVAQSRAEALSLTRLAGGAIGAGLFVSSGGALSTGGPASLVMGYIFVGIALLLTVQALAEMAVMYPVNGAFYDYICRFMDPSWGFALGWDYVSILCDLWAPF